MPTAIRARRIITPEESRTEILSPGIGEEVEDEVVAQIAQELEDEKPEADQGISRYEWPSEDESSIKNGDTVSEEAIVVVGKSKLEEVGEGAQVEEEGGEMAGRERKLEEKEESSDSMGVEAEEEEEVHMKPTSKESSPNIEKPSLSGVMPPVLELASADPTPSSPGNEEKSPIQTLERSSTTRYVHIPDYLGLVS